MRHLPAGIAIFSFSQSCVSRSIELWRYSWSLRLLWQGSQAFYNSEKNSSFMWLNARYLPLSAPSQATSFILHLQMLSQCSWGIAKSSPSYNLLTYMWLFPLKFLVSILFQSLARSPTLLITPCSAPREGLLRSVKTGTKHTKNEVPSLHQIHFIVLYDVYSVIHQAVK